MAYTFQTAYEEIQSLTGDSSSAATTKHKRRWNQAYKMCLKRFNKRNTFTDATVASQQSYALPHNIDKISSIRVTVSSIDYPLQEIVNEDNWNVINDQGTGMTSDTQTHYYVKGGFYYLYPTPTSSSNVITIEGTLTDKDLSVDDTATSSTVKTLAHGDETVVSNAAAFTAAMVGRYLKIDDDGYWYRIASFTNTTEIELETPYGGTSIAAGTAAMTIAEMPLLPEEYQDASIDYACWKYFLSKRENDLADNYKKSWLEVYDNIHPEENYTTSVIVNNQITRMKNPNDYPRI